jgi:hypothetical protein
MLTDVSRDKEVAKAGVRLSRFLARADAVASCDLARQPDLDKLGREIKFTIESHSGRVIEVQVNLAPRWK